MKRYKLVKSDPDYAGQMLVRPDGQYVKYADAHDEIDRLRVLIFLADGALRLAVDLAEDVESYSINGGIVPVAATRLEHFKSVLAALAELETLNDCT